MSTFVARASRDPAVNRKQNRVKLTLYLPILITGQVLPRSGASGPAVWGIDGEMWNKNLLLDWSWTGYGAKEREIPEPPVATNVMDFGAIGDGVFDNTGPINAAIGRAADMGGGTVIIPAGRFLIGGRIDIRSNNIVLQGSGPNITVLYAPEPLARIENQGEEKGGGGGGCLHWPCLELSSLPL